MPKTYGEEFPERPLMAVLSDLLGIQHFSTSKGGTVRSDFLEAVLAALGGDIKAADTKDKLLIACVEAATRQPFDPAFRSKGDTITNKALKAIIDGIAQHGIAGRLSPTATSDVLFPEDDAFERDVDVNPEPFDPALIGDQRDRRLAERAVREGQDRFRLEVLHAYGYSCAVTGTNAVRALDAAHITPYRGPETNVVPNGICLRADIHRLWDGGQFAIDECTMSIVLGAALRISSYGPMHGAKVHVPRLRRDRPAMAALRNHRDWCGL